MIFVMGATGKVGSKIVSHLLAHGKPVRCFARHFGDKKPLPGAEFFQGDANSVSDLISAMRGCVAGFVMIPSNTKAEDARYFQNKLGEAIADAIEESRLHKIVNLSSLGADFESGTGPILGLHDQEERLGELESTDIVHLRPTVFMENLQEHIQTIITMNKVYGVIPAHVKVPMIATKDIAARAAYLLMHPTFKGHSVEHLLGERDLTYPEAVAAIGNAIGKPDLEYVEIPRHELRNYLIGSGMTEDWADAYMELNDAIANGSIRFSVKRDQQNTTATSIENYSENYFSRAYEDALHRLQRPSSFVPREARPL